MIQKKERPWIGWLAAITALITTLPYILGFAFQGDQWRFTGTLVASDDANSYLAKMMLGSAGDWLFRSPYTVFPQHGFLAFLPYILLGKLSAGAGLLTQNIVLFHIFRLSGIAVAVYATYSFSALFIEMVSSRRLATFLAIYGGGLGFLVLGGLGWLWQGVMKMPVEFYSPEVFGFLSFLALPHLVWARGLFLWGLVVFLKGPAIRNRATGLAAGAIWFGMGLFQPLTVVLTWAVVGMTMLLWAAALTVQKKYEWSAWVLGLKRAAWAGVVSSPVVVYNLASFQFDPFLKQWAAANLIPSPPLGDYLLSWGILLPLAGLGIWHWRKEVTPLRWVPIAWLVAFPLLAYFPNNLQRRMVEGSWVALSVMAAVGLSMLPGWKRRMATLWITLAFLSSLIIYVGGLIAVFQPALPLFRPIEESKAMDFLATHSVKGDVVLASYATSTVLPSHAALRVPVGLTPESLNNDDFERKIAQFFQEDTDPRARGNLLGETGARFVFRGPLERKLGSWSPDGYPGLKRIYQNAGYEIYEVIP